MYLQDHRNVFRTLYMHNIGHHPSNPLYLHAVVGFRSWIGKFKTDVCHIKIPKSNISPYCIKTQAPS